MGATPFLWSSESLFCAWTENETILAHKPPVCYTGFVGEGDARY